MSQFSERFERKIEELTRALDAYREFASSLAARVITGDVTEGSRIAQQVREASGPTQFNRLLERVGSGAGSLSVADSGRTRQLTLGFVKGTALFGERDDPMVGRLERGAREGFDQLPSEEFEGLLDSLEQFFAAKRQEVDVIGQEREELKRIVATLISYLHSFRSANTTFQSKIDTYITDMATAISSEDVRVLKAAAIAEMKRAKEAGQALATTTDDGWSRLASAQKRIADLEQALDKVRRDRWSDDLTQLFNRGFFDKAIAAAVRDAANSGKPLCLIMFDIDHFKRFNDSYGHRAGDQVLKTVARIATGVVGSSVAVCRYGGEEFAVVMPGTGLEQGVVIAEALRKGVREHEFVHKDQILKVTISLGVGVMTKPTTTVEALVEATDASLYEAKNKGRDRICLAKGNT